MFLAIMFAVFAANMITIFYTTKNTDEFYYYVQCKQSYESYVSGVKDIDESYFDYYSTKEQKQKEYIENYDDFIKNMTERGNQILSTFNESEESYLKKEVKKTSDDYRKLEHIYLEAEINIGVEEYASYNYGIFFVILLSFILIEFLYFQERRNSLMKILRTTKKGRLKLAFIKWKTGIVLLIGVTLIQEILTLAVYNNLYGMGNLSGCIQSMQIFRDCAYPMTIFKAILFAIVLRIFIAVAVFGMIYMSALLFDQMIVAVSIPGLILVLEFGLDQILQFNGSFDLLKAINFFDLWKMENSVGTYHNLNVYGMPFDKNSVAVICLFVSVILEVVIGIYNFEIKYQKPYKKLQIKLITELRSIFSKLLQTGSLTINEIYKLLFQQKKWILLVLLIAYVMSNINTYVPRTLYQTAYEAAYHMYLSNIQGKCTDEAIAYIDKQTGYLEKIRKEMDEAQRANDSTLSMQLSAEYEYLIEGYDRMMMQYDYLKSDGDLEDKYFVDELFLDHIWSNYKNDIVQFSVLCVILIVLLVGLYTADARYMTEKMISCTKNGRNHLQNTKNICSAVMVLIIMVMAELPKVVAYRNIIEFECLNQKLSDLYTPAIDASGTIGGLITFVALCRLILILGLTVLIIMIAKKTKNELLTSAIGIGGVILVALLLYYMQTNITIFLVEHI